MAATCVMKQVQDRHLAVEISQCVWSPKRDLIAVATVQDQVALYHLSWQKVWQINSPAEDVKVAAVAWRPDSKVLAVGYSSGEVALVNVENSTLIHKLQVDDEVTTLNWALHGPLSQKASDEEVPVEDPWAKYMPPLPPLSKSYGGSEGLEGELKDAWQERQLLQDQPALTLLTVATVTSKVHLYAFGLFHCATVPIGKFISGVGRILDVTPSSDLCMISVIVERTVMGELEVWHLSLETAVFSSHHHELCTLARKYGQIYTLMSYAGHTLAHIEEAWEGILLDMDVKLAAYASTVPEGSVSTDFLELIVFGYGTPELELFLTDKLTEKGLKKLRHSVEMSYSNMQKLVVQNLQSVGQALIFLLSQVVGMARHQDRFGMLGIDEALVTSAIREAGAFFLKSGEIQQVIEVSMRDFQAFLKWLTGVLLRVNGETVPPDISCTTQQELSHIINFLHESLEECTVGIDGEQHTRFRLERVGQYLKDEPLSIPHNSESSSWAKFVESVPGLATHPLIIPSHQQTSLIQEYKSLTKVLHEMGEQPSHVISNAIHAHKFVSLTRIPSSNSARVAQVNVASQNFLYTALIAKSNQPLLYFVRWPTNPTNMIDVPAPVQQVTAIPFVFSAFQNLSGHTLDSNVTLSSPSPLMSVIDIEFYTEETLSVLLHDTYDARNTHFVQLGVMAAAEELRLMSVPHGRCLSDVGGPSQDASMLLDAASHRRLEFGPAAAVAVSGSRKVAAVVSENRRHVRIYEMEVDEDEEEEEDDSQHESLLRASEISDEGNDE